MQRKQPAEALRRGFTPSRQAVFSAGFTGPPGGNHYHNVDSGRLMQSI